jgi:hypothetical protein
MMREAIIINTIFAMVAVCASLCSISILSTTALFCNQDEQEE